ATGQSLSEQALNAGELKKLIGPRQQFGADLGLHLTPVLILVKLESVGDPGAQRLFSRLLSGGIGLAPDVVGIAIQNDLPSAAIKKSHPKIGVGLELLRKSLPIWLGLSVQLELTDGDPGRVRVASDRLRKHKGFLICQTLPRLKRLADLQGERGLLCCVHLPRS